MEKCPVMCRHHLEVGGGSESGLKGKEARNNTGEKSSKYFLNLIEI